MDQPALVLLEDGDPLTRARAHTELGKRAIARRDFQTAEEHLLEAIDLDPTDEVPKTLLVEIPKTEPAPRGFAAWVRGWLRPARP